MKEDHIIAQLTARAKTYEAVANGCAVVPLYPGAKANVVARDGDEMDEYRIVVSKEYAQILGSEKYYIVYILNRETIGNRVIFNHVFQYLACGDALAINTNPGRHILTPIGRKPHSIQNNEDNTHIFRQFEIALDENGPHFA